MNILLCYTHEVIMYCRVTYCENLIKENSVAPYDLDIHCGKKNQMSSQNRM